MDRIQGIYRNRRRNISSIVTEEKAGIGNKISVNLSGKEANKVSKL